MDAGSARAADAGYAACWLWWGGRGLAPGERSISLYFLLTTLLLPTDDWYHPLLYQTDYHRS